MKILAVVVLYNQNLYNTNIYNTLLKYQDHLKVISVIFDNSPKKQINKIPKDLIYIWNNGINLGLSECYNKATSYAKEYKCDWILLLDQDTSFPSNAWDTYLQCIEEHPKYFLYAPIHKTNTGKYLSPKNPILGTSSKCPIYGECSLKQAYPINSGLLISLHFFIQIGGYNPKIRVDFSDIQFISKARKEIRTFYILNIICIQDFSNETLDINKLYNRFKLFCEGGYFFQYRNNYERIIINYLILKHTIGLSIKNKTIRFLKYYITNYLTRL